MGPAALSLMWQTKNFGTVMLETTRLPERDEPYILNLELARDMAESSYVQVEGTVYSPDGRSTPVRLRQTAPGRFEGAADR